MKIIHGNIKVRMMELGIRQEWVAEVAGYNTSRFSRILRGRDSTPDGTGVGSSWAMRCSRAVVKVETELVPVDGSFVEQCHG